MKPIIRLFALLSAFCLLAGCASGMGQTGEPQASGRATERTGPASTEPAPTTENDEPAPGSSEPAPASGEPEGWEEEWPEEYPVKSFRLLDGAIRQTGRLNQYRYAQLDGAERYVDLAADYVREALACGDALTVREDSPHDGYANWFMDAPEGSAAVSGSSVTGRFTFSLYPGFDRILEMTERAITDRETLEQAAWAFVRRFSGVTGELELVRTADEAVYYADERSSEMKDVSVPAVVYTFRSAEHSNLLLELCDGLDAPVLCGDSTVEDLSAHCFAVTVWPDGTVVRGSNYITRAQAVPDGSVRMLDESDVPELISYLTSTTENDTVVIERVLAESFSVYFGYAAIEPVLTVTYSFESDPADRRSTEFVMGLFEDGAEER